MLKSEFSTDKDGFPRAAFAPPYQVIGWFLEDDVQRSLESCSKLLDICRKVEANELEEWSGTGNAHTVVIRNPLVTIENNYVEEDEALCTVEIGDFTVAIQSWSELISRVGADT